MRTIPNPEKFKNSKIQNNFHRIVIPVYIPDSDVTYFSNLFEIFKVSIQSLLKTTDASETVITIINNNCKKEVSDYIDCLLLEAKIDKHVKLATNYGKVYTILSEAKGCYEPYITIADADVFYFNNWEDEVFKVFNNFTNIGVVSPVPSPHLVDYHNSSYIIKNLFKLKKGNIINSKSFALFKQGISNNPNFFKKKNYDCLDLHYYLEKNNVKSCLGATHFIATYNSRIFKDLPLNKPKYTFKMGDEGVFIDKFIDKFGYGRLSTNNAFAYHLGHSIPKWCESYEFLKIERKNLKPNSRTYNLNRQSIILRYFYSGMYKILKKMKWLKIF
ncbi:glycosyltransferase family A protein [Lutibacter flavus]|uniref:Glycosyl transferase family 2 n=1 Tax=Lutibacter flavus TaxID=691689 RepID=A0A238VS03_9FLAO|nr:glycosyltransferase family A protein [Lutibacter flavus]SNR36583.1 hypothetical protein SAMN04488111_0888 [Lutibacter flavus]